MLLLGIRRRGKMRYMLLLLLLGVLCGCPKKDGPKEPTETTYNPMPEVPYEATPVE